MLEKLKFRLFILYKLPSAFFAGLRLVRVDDSVAEIRVRHSWWNQNPFRSMYFAVQAMAGEMSTGLMVLRKIEESKKSISMLVTRMEVEYTKKATGWIHFKCEDGQMISEAVNKAITTKEGQDIWVTSTGVDSQGDKVSEFRLKWSIKERTKR